MAFQRNRDKRSERRHNQSTFLQRPSRESEERSSATGVERFLRGINFPANKEDLLYYAQDNNAPQNVLEAVEGFSDKEYYNATDIAKEMGNVRPRRRLSGKPSAARVEHYLRGVDFPAEKSDLVARAKDNEAPDEVMNVFNQLEEREYFSAIDVSKQLSRIQPSTRRRTTRRGAGGPSASTIEHYLKGIEFPANKDELLAHAEENDVSDEVLELMEQFDDKDYYNVTEVAQQMGQVKGKRGSRSAASPGSANVERYMRGIAFPAYKNDVLDTAEDNGAPEEVMRLLESLEDREYYSPIEIAKQVGHIKRGGSE